VEEKRQRLAAQQQQAIPVESPTQEGQEDHEGVAGIEGLEDEADQQGAFNPETGEINWDCPCLGGMAHGPCGEEFKAAFSCFVYSKEEPKGMECIDKFK
jgi:intermembrane space import and assembly protein 40